MRTYSKCHTVCLDHVGEKRLVDLLTIAGSRNEVDERVQEAGLDGHVGVLAPFNERHIVHVTNVALSGLLHGGDPIAVLMRVSNPHSRLMYSMWMNEANK